MKRLSLQCALLAAAMALSVSAATVTSNLPEYNGLIDSQGFPVSPVAVGTFNYTIPAGDHIVAATFTSTWGNTQNDTTAAVDLYVGGVLVGSCSAGASCNTGDGISNPTAFSFNFAPSSFAMLSSGSVVVAELQNGPYYTRLGAETLSLTTATPEPASLALFGMGAAALSLLRIRRSRRV